MKEEIKGRLEQIRRGEIPDGYRRTKAGIIPDEWKISRLRDSGRKCLKKNADFKIRLVFSNSAQNGIIPQEEQFDKSIANKEHIDGYYIVTPGDFVYNPRISVTAPCGPINRNETEKTGIVSPLYTVFTVDFPKADNAYLKHYFKSSYWFQYMKGVANYGVRHDRMNISDADFFAMPFPMPSIAEQQKIADILSAQDSVIELKERLITEKQRQKKYLMQRLLTGKQRLPGFVNDWKSYVVGEIGAFYGGLSGKRKEDFGTGSAFYITFKNVLENVEISPRQLGRVQLHQGEKQNAVKKYDLFFNLSSETAEEVGMCAVLLEDLSDTYLNSFCVGFRIQDKNIFAHWLSYYFNSPVGREKMRSLAQGITRVNLNRKAFSNMEISIPSVEEQKAIVSVLSAADREIELLRASLEQEKRKKKALSQLLLTGIVRV